MGSSDEPSNNAKEIDASVGGLVWVRRRNGSWWPGRILGFDEISEGSMVSPRSGTPVKLLGREDASVDWYNLEKSKRVKAFRCGEYDDCIEKARANAATGNKKAVKYARREDAILHALEIENDQLGRDGVDFSVSNNSGGELVSSAKESRILSDSGRGTGGMTEEESDPGDLKENSDSRSASIASASDSESDSDSGSAPELSQSVLSFEEPTHLGASNSRSVKGKRRRTPNDSEDDGTKRIKRMRGLEDLGMVVGDSSAGNCLSNGSTNNGSKGCNTSMKRKRTQVANVHEFLKRKNRHRPLTKVLESTAVLPVPAVCDQLTTSNGSPLHGLSDSKISGIESNESRKSVSVAVNNNSDSIGVSCENGASMNPSGHGCDASQVDCKIKKENDVAGVSGFAENDSSDRLFTIPFVGEEKNSEGLSPAIVSSSTRHEAGGLGSQSCQSSQAEDASPRNDVRNECGPRSSADTCINNISQRMEKGTSRWQLKGKRNSRHTSKIRKQEKRKYMSVDDNHDTFLPGMDHLDGLFQSCDQKVDCDGARRLCTSFNCNLLVKSKQLPDDHVGGVKDRSKSYSNRELHSSVASVDMALPPQRLLPLRQSRFIVNSRYQTSDFPGRTITESKLYDVKLDVKANYQPQNVPLVSLMSKLNGKAIVGRPLPVELLVDGYCDFILSNEFYPSPPDLAPPIRNAEGRRILTKTKLQFYASKSSRRRSGLLSKKIRKLSSLTSKKEECKKPGVEKLEASVVACVPLKLVFSRINEALNGSARQKSSRSLTSNDS